MHPSDRPPANPPQPRPASTPKEFPPSLSSRPTPTCVEGILGSFQELFSFKLLFNASMHEAAAGQGQQNKENRSSSQAPLGRVTGCSRWGCRWLA